MNFQEASLQVNSRTFKLNHVELENAIVAFFFEDQCEHGNSCHSNAWIWRDSVWTFLSLGRQQIYDDIKSASGEISWKDWEDVNHILMHTMLDETEALRIYSKLLDKIVTEREMTVLQSRSDSGDSPRTSLAASSTLSL